MATVMTINRFTQAGSLKGLEMQKLSAAIRIAEIAKSLCPEDKGQLRDSLMWSQGSKRGGQGVNADRLLDPIGQSQTIVGTNSDHWYPEFGTRNQVAQPFLRPAAELLKGLARNTLIKKYGREAMKKEFRKRKKERKEL